MGRIRANVDIQTRADLLELVVEFNWKLDHAEPAGFAGLFTAEGTLITPQGRHHGAASLQDYADATTSTEQISRSVLSNHRLVRLSECTIEGTVLVTSYLHKGAPPAAWAGAAGALPHSVSEYRDVYVKADDTWRLQERRSILLFAGTNDAIPPKDNA